MNSLISRCCYFLLISLFFACTDTSEKAANEEATKQPNIILIMTDDQGWGDLSVNGNANLQTPNIDALAENGAMFEYFYVSPVCSPTRAELLTGRYAVRGGVYSTSAGGERLDLDEVTVAQYLQKAGYATACYGKWHNGMQYPYHPNGRGFDDFYGFCSGHWGNYIDPMLERNGQIVQGEGFIIDDLTNKGIEFIEQNKESPFFLYLPLNTPHSPMQVPDKWWNEVKDREITQKHKDPEKEDETFTKAALAFCENIDWNVGRIMAALKENEIEENTLVIYLSDNGPNSWRWNGGMKGRKGSTDEGGVRSPLIMQWKNKIQSGSKLKAIASAPDILPTLAEIAGYEGSFENALDGQSLLPLLIETEENWADRYIVNHWNGKTSIRSQEYRLGHEDQLFDMVNDFGQTMDISGDYPEVYQTMLTVKQNWENSVMPELPKEDKRDFTIGHPDFDWYQLPARDLVAHGNIKRSNRWPNSSFYTNWIDAATDSLTLDVEVLETGDFEAIIYYTCQPENTGASFRLAFMQNTLDFKINESFTSDFLYPELDRVERQESYEKRYKALNVGKIHLEKGKGQLVLKATDIPGKAAVDFRLLMLKRV